MAALRVSLMRVRSLLPNMSAQVSGVGFTPAPDGNGWLSDDLTPALAQAFAVIPGYRLEPDAPTVEPLPPDPLPPPEVSRGRPRKTP